MRLSVILAFFAVSFAVAACDRAVPVQEQEVEQAQGPNLDGDIGHEEATEASVPGNILLESEAGLKAELSRDFAGTPVPDALFTGADGRKLKLADFSGRPLLVNIWATWCAPCKKEMPALDKLAEMEAGQLSVIAISQDLQGRKPVRAFFEQAGIVNLEGYNDRKNLISVALAPSLPLPATVLFDSGGKEVWRVIGPVEWDREEISALLDEAS